MNTYRITTDQGRKTYTAQGGRAVAEVVKKLIKEGKSYSIETL